MGELYRRGAQERGIGDTHKKQEECVEVDMGELETSEEYMRDRAARGLASEPRMHDESYQSKWAESDTRLTLLSRRRQQICS